MMFGTGVAARTRWGRDTDKIKYNPARGRKGVQEMQRGKELVNA